MKIEDLFKKPRILGIIGDANSGKSNLIYNLVSKSREKHNFKLYTYGLKYDIGDTKIYSVEELESIRNSVIIVDEFFSLFDLEDRKKRNMIERTLRLIFHNNNVLLICGLPENFKKFISNKLNMIFFMKCALGDFINGSRVKSICLSYRGDELGSSVLNLRQSESILFNGSFTKLNIPYLKRYDSKKNNEDILKSIKKRPIKRAKSVPKKVEKEVKEEKTINSVTT